MPTVITCGVYGFTAEEFEKAVVKAKPDVFVDIRLRRGVRGSQYSFANSKRLQSMLDDNDISYTHRRDLAPPEYVIKHEGEVDKEQGIARHDRDHLSDEFIKNYQKAVLDEFDAEEFMESLDNPDRALLLCVENTAEACHRGLLAGAIVDQLGWHRVDLTP